MSDHPATPGLTSTGISGLDEILKGGLPDGRLYLLEGSPGAGKTTIALQFLLHAAQQGASTLYITLSETTEELMSVAASHGWDLSPLSLFELGNADEALSSEREQTLFHAWENELGQTIALITDRIEAVQPTVVVFDSLSEMRLLAQDPLRYRRQILTLKKYFADRRITVLLTDDMTGNEGQSDAHLHSLCHGVVTLERLTLEFGGARRRLQVRKLRGVNFIAGFHDFDVRHGGVVVFPRLISAQLHTPFFGEPTLSGLAELDALMGGGPPRGTTSLIMGPAGSGKTNLALQYVSAACARGEPAVICEFDERIGTLLTRAEHLGLGLKQHVDSGLLVIRQIDPASISPGEFACQIREHVEGRSVKLLVIDSLAGYLASMPQENQLLLQLHELLAYLNQQGVSTFLINTQQSLVGSMATGGLHVSHLADAVLLLRFFESAGRIRKAVSVIKNRGGAHEDTIRELRIDAHGLRIGEVLDKFSGVLTGVPVYRGDAGHLMDERNARS